MIPVVSRIHLLMDMIETRCGLPQNSDDSVVNLDMLILMTTGYAGLEDAFFHNNSVNSQPFLCGAGA